jgi:hypothetical protein
VRRRHACSTRASRSRPRARPGWRAQPPRTAEAMRGARLAGRPSRSRARDTGTRAIVGPIERDTFRHRQVLLRVRAPRPEPTCGPGAIRASPRARAVSENGAAAGRATPPGASASGATRTDDAISSICRTPENTRQFEPATDTTESVARSENSKSEDNRNESKSERLRRRSRRWYVQRRLIYESSDGRRVSPGSGARERTLRASDGGCADRRTRTRAALDARGERARRHATCLLSSRRSVSLFVIRARLSRRARSSPTDVGASRRRGVTCLPVSGYSMNTSRSQRALRLLQSASQSFRDFKSGSPRSRSWRGP